ncbi:MAG TPA: hypothetical protein VFG14_13785 [Chthoniobacteraceae bacterium]|nr:hypothetical protein [Chthoniobacteraceae bacterium]
MRFLPVLALLAIGSMNTVAEDQWVTYEGRTGPGKGKHIVFLSGDEEYRSEEGLPQLARILSERHGFKCTVLFSINPKTGEIDPETTNNTPGLEALGSADLCIMLLRFRALPDEQMKHFADYYLTGKPIIALRTSTHAFNYGKDSGTSYAKYHWQSKEWPGGFGKQVLGETWVAHHGAHKVEGTRGIIEPAASGNPILRGVEDIFGDTDVYTATPPPDATVLVRGQVTETLDPKSGPVAGKKNEPMQPVVWLRVPPNETGKKNYVLTTTMGSSTDLKNEGLRRLIVNATYAFTGLEVPAKADVSLVGDYQPTMYGFKGHKKGVKPADLK